MSTPTTGANGRGGAVMTVMIPPPENTAATYIYYRLSWVEKQITTHQNRRSTHQPAPTHGHYVRSPDDWEGDQPLKRDFDDSIIYEMHVRGFTAHPNSGVAVAKRGTYAGLIDKIPFLQALGVTTVELMPVQQFDAQDAPDGLTNFWGYQPVALFAPHGPYSSRRDPLGPV